MTTRRLRSTLLAASIGVVIACVATSTAAAQAASRLPERSEALKPGEIQRLFDAYTLVQAQEMLNLRDDQYERFAVRLRRLQAVRRQNLAARMRLMQTLNRLSRQTPPPGESELEAALAALSAHDARARDVVARAYADVDEVLDVSQRARFRVFEQQMERKKLEIISRARAQQRARRNALERQRSRQ